MSRPRTSGLRDMNQPTIADLRGSVDEATRYCEDAEAWADDAAAAARRSRGVLLVGGVIQILVLAVETIILVTR